MNIFVITLGYPNKHNPQANVFVQDQVKQLSQMGCKITVIDVVDISFKKIKYRANKSIEISNDGYANIISSEKKALAWNRFPNIYSSRYKKHIYRLFDYATQKFGVPDIIYAHFSFCAGYFSTLIGEKYQIPVVIIEHYSLLMNKQIPKVNKKMLKHSIQNAANFITVSNNLKLSINNHLKCENNIEVVPNIIDNRFHYHKREKKDSFIFFSVGNLIERKRFELLIEAFCDVFSVDENVILKIGGGGKLYSKLKKMIVSRNRENQIILLGPITRDQVISYNIEADCFVLPSAKETFGVVYREAMAIGRPIITTNHGGFDLFDEKVGKIVEVDNLQQLSNSLRYLRDNIQQYDERYISNKCLEYCSAERVGENIYEILYNARESFVKNKKI